MTVAASSLQMLVADELAQPVDARVARMAEAIAAAYPDSARAVLFYGSCLRSSELDGQMLDFYLIVSSYRQSFGKGWLATANRLIPPNVFPFAHGGLAAKYAVLSEEDFFQLNGPRTLSVSVWARFAQPARLVWAADQKARQACVAAVGRAAPTLLEAARPMLAPEEETDALACWRRAFALTYRAELRAERGDRAASVVDADPDRYSRWTGPVLDAAGLGRVDERGRMSLRPVSDRQRARAERLWRKRRRTGKILSVVRLAKASATFAGGIDYLAWKINRHAGTAIAIRPWQRRWPLLGAVTLLPRLLRRGAIR